MEIIGFVLGYSATILTAIAFSLLRMQRDLRMARSSLYWMKEGWFPNPKNTARVSSTPYAPIVFGFPSNCP
jgi:hypothetical protein